MILAATLLLAPLATGSPLPYQVDTSDERTPLVAKVDPRVEALSIVFRLAGHPEYNKGRVEFYTQAVEEQFRPLEKHAVVKQARMLRLTRGVSYDAVASFALHLHPEFPAKVKLIDSPSLERRWPEDCSAFVEALESFVKDADFAGFLATHADFYAECEKRLGVVLKEADLSWFDGFFGAKAKARFKLAVSLLNGPSNYGPSVTHEDGSTSFHCILGSWKTDEYGVPVYDTSMLATVAHEFCHSYCNPYVDANLDALEESLSAIYATVAEKMKKQAYGNWRTMGCESLVRASVTRYVTATEGDEAGEKHADYEIGRGFAWTRELAALMAEYEKDRERYPTFDVFFSRVIAFFEEYAGREN